MLEALDTVHHDGDRLLPLWPAAMMGLAEIAARAIMGDIGERDAFEPAGAARDSPF